MFNTKDEAERYRRYGEFLREWHYAFGVIASTGSQSMREALDQADGDEARSLAFLAKLRRSRPW